MWWLKLNYFYLPLEEWTNRFVDDWLLPVMSGFFDGISDGLSRFVMAVTQLLTIIPPEVITVLLIAIAWKTAGKGVAIFAFIGCVYIGSIDMWMESMQTVAIVIVATITSIVIGVPVGILTAISKTLDSIVRPILDIMQTLPIFVYLIPAVLLFGLGGVPAVIATFVFAAPPAIRMTSLGIKQVPGDIVEASHSFGSTLWQLLFKVQLPLALPTIMAGINQTIMLSLSMAVVASMIGAPGLGAMITESISTVNVGLGLAAGLAIVVLAIVLDRMTQGLVKTNGNEGM